MKRTMEPKKLTGKQVATNVGRGMLMGGADIIPGVSGGTVALILGIYERLVTAISHVDLELLSLVRTGHVREAAEHLDLKFLVSLGTGIGLGILSLGSLVNQLLSSTNTRELTLAAFFGIILASSYLVACMIEFKSPQEAAVLTVLGLLGAGFAFWLTGLQGEEVTLSYGYVFVCGMIGICAMILPGISGAYILLILGAYLPLTDILKALPRGHVGLSELTIVLVFGAGCAIGLIAFSKVLRWLLARHEAPTMAILCGFMIGALRKIWPFQTDLTPEVEKVKHKMFENTWPEAIDGHVIACLAIATVGLLAVLFLDRLTGAHEKVPLEDTAS